MVHVDMNTFQSLDSSKIILDAEFTETNVKSQQDEQKMKTLIAAVT